FVNAMESISRKLRQIPGVDESDLPISTQKRAVHWDVERSRRDEWSYTDSIKPHFPKWGISDNNPTQARGALGSLIVLRAFQLRTEGSRAFFVGALLSYGLQLCHSRLRATYHSVWWVRCWNSFRAIQVASQKSPSGRQSRTVGLGCQRHRAAQE